MATGADRRCQEFARIRFHIAYGYAGYLDVAYNLINYINAIRKIPYRTTQKSFYVEISRARDRAELVTDDAAELKAQLQAVTGERIAALEAVGEAGRETKDRAAGMEKTDGGQPERGRETGAGRERDGPVSSPKEQETPAPERGRGRGMDLGL